MNKSDAFSDMQLSPGMLQTLGQVGFDEPTPIQKKSIPELLKGRDLLGQAQTGTGKTAAFAVPVIETVDEHDKKIQALVVCPTRELCLQVCGEIKRLSTHTSGIAVTALYGGQAIDQQFKALKSLRPQIIVATPGRLFDHLRRKSIDLSTVKMIVLDEADEMLDMGFREEIEQIFDLLPEENQRIFFSATMPKAIMDLVHNYLRDPVIIKVEAKNLTVLKISQSYFRVRPKEKTGILCRVLDYRDPKLAVIFTNAKSTADEIVDEIKHRGFEAGVLHGDLSQSQRDRVMALFKSGQIRVLVATDIAARGIDIDDIELVLNYHLPHDPEDYVHRIGRTGRAGRAGRAISLVEPRDNSRLRKIMQFARTEIIEEEPPTITEVKAAKIASLFGKIKNALASEMIGEYRTFLAKQTLPSDDVAAGLIQMALEKFDENSRDDDFNDSIRGKKYSGFGAQKRGDFNEGRNGDFDRKRQGFSRDFQSDRDRGPRAPRRPFEDSAYAGRPRNSYARDGGGEKQRFGRNESFRFDRGAPSRDFRNGRQDTRPNGAPSKDFRESRAEAKPRRPEGGSWRPAPAGRDEGRPDFKRGRSDSRPGGHTPYGTRPQGAFADKPNGFEAKPGFKKSKFKPGAKPANGRPKPKNER